MASSLMVSPLLSLTRTQVIGFKAHLCHPGGSQLRVLTFITSTKTIFPNKVTFTSSGSQHLCISFEATIQPSMGAFSGVHRLGQVQSQAGVSRTCSYVRGHVLQGDDGQWAAEADGALWQGKLEFGVGQVLAGMGTVVP